MLNFDTTIFHPAWVTGFIDGEGTFYIGLPPKKDMISKRSVSLEFAITQHIRDKAMMEQLVLFFGCGYLASPSSSDTSLCSCQPGGRGAKDGDTKYQYRIRKVADLVKLFTLFEAYPLHTQKRLDAAAFKVVLDMVLAKQHLSVEGVAKIKAIKATMNRARMAEYKL